MRYHSAVLFVTNIEASTKFYTELLGFKVADDFGNNLAFEEGLSLWQVQDSHEIAKKLPVAGPGNRFELCFEHEDMDDLYEKLKIAKVKFFQHLNEETWGQRTVRFFDPDGHLIEVGEPMPVFVKNLAKKGLSETDIHEKTGMPLDTVKKLLT
jgi:catechol 2,3-dioxygenase-like lactoylglutathione lyase family enzyme